MQLKDKEYKRSEAITLTTPAEKKEEENKMTLEELRKLREFKDVVDNNHAKEIADELNRSREVYYTCSNGYGTQEISDVLDTIEWNNVIGKLDGFIEIEVHENGNPKTLEIPVEIEVENWNEECQCFEMESVEMKDVEEW